MIESFFAVLLLAGFVFFVLFLKQRIVLKNLKSNLLDVTEIETKFENKIETLNNKIIESREEHAVLKESYKNVLSQFDAHKVAAIETIADLESKLTEASEDNKKIISQKKSSEVRLGSIAETLAPFLDQFDFDPETCVFMGKPIDYISFGQKNITFIEIKSGKSQLNSKQRQIRDQVLNKMIAWKEVRIT